MSFTYVQRTGHFYHMADGQTQDTWTGYSGAVVGGGKNNPAKQQIEDVGPIPVGEYTISPKQNFPDLNLVDAMRLTPAPGNQMFGRSGFLIHGDSTAHPGEASHGCIILGRNDRMRVATLVDQDEVGLTVVAEEP